MGQRPSTSLKGDVFRGNDGHNLNGEALSGELLIPLDILNMLLESLDWCSLSGVSILNKNINHFVNRRLWSVYFIFPPTNDTSKLS